MNTPMKQALLASAALSFAAVAIAGCASSPNYRYTKDSGNLAHAQPAYATATPTVSPTLARAGSAVVVQNPAVVTPQYTTVPNTIGGTVIVPGTSVPTSIVVPGDVDFMARASQFNATEQNLSRVAYQRADTEDVREFARQMLDNHRRMADELDGIALRHNVSLAWQPNPAGSDAINRISALSGRDFDRAYLDQVIADQQAAAELYQTESDTATDATLRSTAGGDAVYLRNLADQAYRLRNDLD